MWSLKQWILEHLLRYFQKKVDLVSSFTFFLELELVEPDVFDRKFYETGGVKLFFCSGVPPNTPLAS
jgi:hypothetical protein